VSPAVKKKKRRAGERETNAPKKILPGFIF